VYVALAIATVHTQNFISAGLNALHHFLIGRNSGQAAPEYDGFQIAVPQQLSGLRNQPTATRAMADECGPVKPSFRLGSSFAAWQ